VVAQNGQSIEIGNTYHTRQRIKTKQKQEKTNTMCAGHHYPQANTNNVNKTCALLQTTGGKERINHRLYAEITTRNPKRKDT
jgi:hypothetical protein